MNISDLKHRLLKFGIRDDAFEIEGKFADEAYILKKENDRWFVYYTERGLKTGLREFDSESEACNYFFGLVTSDISTHKQ